MTHQGSQLTHTQLLQIEDWLRATDKLIREGRYIVADELLQKVFAIHPENDIAHAYQERIQFLIKQLSQRVGLNSTTQAEIRKYRDLSIERNQNQVSTLLVSAQKYLDDGYLKRASNAAAKALALDPENAYARSFVQRLMERQQSMGLSEHDSDLDLKFRAVLKEAWRNGIPSEAQQTVLKKIQSELGIDSARLMKIEREVRNLLYKEALHNIWLTGGLAAFTNDAIDNLRQKYQISRMDHSMLEASLLREVRKDKIKGTVLVVEEDEAALLELTTELRSSSFAVIAASTVDEAVQTLSTTTPDAVISELTFTDGPGGLELYTTVRRTPPTARTIFIFMTKSLDRPTHLIGKRLGVDEFMTKPLDFELLLATLTGKLIGRTRPPTTTVSGQAQFPAMK